MFQMLRNSLNLGCQHILKISLSIKNYNLNYTGILIKVFTTNTF